MLRYSANLSMLFQEIPFLKRFAAARSAGFEAVECWFPYKVPVGTLRAVLAAEGLTFVAINSPAGDLSAGEWGLAALPGREATFKTSFMEALRYATELRIGAVHVMAGVVRPGTSRIAALGTLRQNLAWALREAERAPVDLLIEPLNGRDRPGYLLRHSDEAARIIAEFGVSRLKMLFDIYHVQISEGDITDRLRRHLPSIGHIQIAAVPSRAEPDEGELDYASLLREIERLGWKGWIGCEYRPRSTTLDGLQWRQQFKDAPRLERIE
jgi:hydroxypyruvate isomerase